MVHERPDLLLAHLQGRLGRDRLPQELVALQLGPLACGQVRVGDEVHDGDTDLIGLHSPAARKDELRPSRAVWTSSPSQCPSRTNSASISSSGRGNWVCSNCWTTSPIAVAVQLLGTSIPVANATRANLPYQKRIGCEFEKLGLKMPIWCASGRQAGRGFPVLTQPAPGSVPRRPVWHCGSPDRWPLCAARIGAGKHQRSHSRTAPGHLPTQMNLCGRVAEVSVRRPGWLHCADPRTSQRPTRVMRQRLETTSNFLERMGTAA